MSVIKLIHIYLRTVYRSRLEDRRVRRALGYVFYNQVRTRNLENEAGLKGALIDVPSLCFGKWSKIDRKVATNTKARALLFTAVSLALMTWLKVPADQASTAIENLPPFDPQALTAAKEGMVRGNYGIGTEGSQAVFDPLGTAQQKGDKYSSSSTIMLGASTMVILLAASSAIGGGIIGSN